MADLKAYRAKRRFDRTPEPAANGAAAGADEARFVVQKHAARRLHYDLRLEIAGVMKSWAVPQGPCLDPKVKRFAKQTEDHPLDYAGFEGVIPAGEYGAGAMIVWDRGAFVSLEDPETALAKGEFKFRLAGEKLSGGWMLKRLKGDGDWILIKERDTAARALDDYDVLAQRPESVMSGQTIADFAPKSSARPALAPVDPATLKGARKAPLPAPGSVKPMLATAVSAPPAQAGWVHEIKFDGYRTLCFVAGGAARLMTRNGLDWTERYGLLGKALAKLPCESALLDGEVVAQDARGVTSLDRLEEALSDRRTGELTFFAFDLLHLNGFDLTGCALLDRKRALEALIDPLRDPRSPIQFSEHIEGDGVELFAHASRLGLEGVVSKLAASPYVQARAKNWVKAKRVDEAEFVVIGFTTNAPQCVAALALADLTPDGLAYVGRVGSGISDTRARDLFALLSPHAIAKPITPVPRTPKATWIEPAFTAHVGYRARTDEGLLRQPAFLSIAPRVAPKAALKPRLVTDRDLAAIRLTNPEREMFEGSGTTKLDVALHYARVGDWMLPELMNRPLTLIRCASGRMADCFYQRHAFHGLLPGVAAVDLADDDAERAAYITVTQPRGLLGLTQFGAVEFHLWGCHVDAPETPDRLVFDLDPAPELSWARVCDAAEALKARLEALGFTPFLRTTGGKGLHLVVALTPSQTWEIAKPFAQAVAKAAARDDPASFVATASKKARTGKVYVDYLRNGRGASAVASYSLRARPEFTVATPITWQELRALNGGGAFTIKNIVNRLERLARDPWDGLSSTAIPITAKMRRDVGFKN